jgi:hypothetical protein
MVVLRHCRKVEIARGQHIAVQRNEQDGRTGVLSEP